MITILKEGKKNIGEAIYYKHTCNRCGCEFEFEKEDFKQISADLGGMVGPTSFYDIICPHCKQHTVISIRDLDKLEKRRRIEEFEWQETEDEYFEKYLRKFV